MKENLKNKKAFALLIAMGLTLVMGLTAFFIFEYMVPFAKNTKGIENSARAYYQAESAVEDSLYYVYKTRTTPASESGTTMPSSALGNNFSMIATGSILPPAGRGSSDFDKDWNIIRLGESVQLEVGDDAINDWNSVDFYFRVPDLDGDGNPDALSGGTTPIINWKLTSENNALNADLSWITADNIDESAIKFSSKTGMDLFGNTSNDFSTFYSSNCGAGSGCALKLSVVNKLELSSNNTPVPYIEWKIDTNNQNIPLRYTIINTSGKSYGFKKDLEVKVPQQTVNEAFDFTVLQ